MPSAFFNRFNDSRRKGLVYPSPFFDIAQTYMPPTVKELFKWCTYYFYTHPIINPVVYKMAEYPITELLYQEVKKPDEDGDAEQEPDEVTKDAYKEILEDSLDVRTSMINSGLDYFTYGNAFVSITFPFIRFLVCSGCKHKVNIQSLDKKKWSYKAFKFNMECPKCSANGTAEYFDKDIKDRSKIALIRWDPDDINIDRNPLTGRSTYTYTIPENIRKAILVGKQALVADTPKVFLEAVQKTQDVLFDKKNFFHMKRCTLADKDQGWGKPLILPAMRDAFYLQILRKANEAIAFQYIVPLTVIFPQPHGNLDPYKHMNLTRWRERVEQEIATWKDDPNYIPVMPIPMGNQQIFGNSKALMVTPEIRALSEQMVTGMGVPTEFVFGGLSYSGSSVSLRIVENHLLRYRESMLRMLRFFTERIRLYCNLAPIVVDFQDFKMADDIQQQQLMAAFVQNRQISLSTGLQHLGLPHKNEEEKIKKESDFVNELSKDQMIVQAEAQGEGNLLLARYQMQAESEAQLEQLKQQNKIMTENPQAAQMLMQMQMQQQGGMPAEGGGAPPEGGGAPAQAPEGAVAPPMPTQATAPPGSPQQTQQHTGPMTPTVSSGGYGHGGDDIQLGEEVAIDPRLMALQLNAQLNAMQPGQRRQFDHLFKTQMPELAGLISQVQKNQSRFKTEKPMPTQRPPRREGGSPV